MQYDINRCDSFIIYRLLTENCLSSLFYEILDYKKQSIFSVSNAIAYYVYNIYMII